jgi:hypothetical protein
MTSPEYFISLIERIKKAQFGEKSQLVQDAADFLGCSPIKIYRELKKNGFTPNRKQRSDKGEVSLSREEAVTLANLLIESTRQNGKRLLSVGDAIEIAHANGMIVGRVSPATAIRIMREFKVHPEQLKKPTPHVVLRSLNPNHVWEFDVSVCVLYYLDSGGLSVMLESEFYKNKPENVKKIENKRVLRYLATDHYSGAFSLLYIMSAGESQEALFNFMIHAFSKKDNELMHGVPQILLWDKGSANTSFLIKNFLDRMTVKHIAHTTHNPRAKGQVESTHNLIERQFEGRLYLLKVQDIDDLNAKAQTWSRWFQSTKIHRRHGHTRYGMWQTIKKEQLRLCPSREVCESLLQTKPEKRKVRGDLTITYAPKGDKTRIYRVAHLPDVRVGDEIEVCINPYKSPCIDAVVYEKDGTAVHFNCEPTEMDNAGFPMNSPVIGEQMKSAPHTPNETVRQEMMQQAYGVSTSQEVEKLKKQKTPAFNGEVDPFTYLEKETLPNFITRKGEEIQVDAPKRVSEAITAIRALGIIKEQLGRNLKPNESKWFLSSYPNGISEEEIPDVVAQINGDISPKLQGVG